MISLELSTIKSKDGERAWLAQAMADFESRGPEHDVGRPTENSVDTNLNISGENRGVKIQKTAKTIAFEADIAEKLKGYYEAGVVAASKDLHMSARRLSYIAQAHGVKFASRSSVAAAAEDKLMAPKILALAETGMSQQAIGEELNLSRKTVKRIGDTYSIRFRSLTSIARDEKLVERIKAIRDIGCSRAECCRRLEINPKVLVRLIVEYKFEYPLQVAPRKCAA